jgi:rod shape-determining protein MreD
MSARPNFLATRPVTSLKSSVGNRSRREPEYLLLPVNPWFMWATLFAAMLLSMLPLGRVNWWPDLLAIALVFWNVHQPRRVGVGVAFAFGLIIDVHSGALLGQNALSYTALSFLAISMHRRIVWFSLGTQALHVLPLFIAAQLLEILVRMGLGGQWPGLGFFIAPLIEASLWPLVSLISLAPQRRPVNSDKNRPVL